MKTTANMTLTKIFQFFLCMIAFLMRVEPSDSLQNFHHTFTNRKSIYLNGFSSRHFMNVNSVRHDDEIGNEIEVKATRRLFFKSSLATIRSSLLISLISCSTPSSNALAVTTSGTKEDISRVLTDIKNVKEQLKPIPDLIKAEKWDSIRNILKTPPVSFCWIKSSMSTNPILSMYANAVGDAGGEELEALELNEDLLYHMQFLDMAVYNNIFNPIKSEGESGATKELIRSYYEDPGKEFNAVSKVVNDLISLSDGLI